MDVSSTDRDLMKLNDVFRLKVYDRLAEVKQNTKYEIFITEGYRTTARQKYLYSFGRTRPGAKRTRTLNSVHMQGKAVDIAFKGRSLYPKDHAVWEEIAKIGEKNGIERGYILLDKKEKCHFQDNGKPYVDKKFKNTLMDSEVILIKSLISSNSKRRHNTDNREEKSLMNKTNDKLREILKAYKK